MAELLFAIGELSTFHENHGFYVDGIGRNTAVLPSDWEDRVVTVPAENLDGARVVGLCLDPHDLCVSKLIANREKDREFVSELVKASLIEPGILLERLVDVTPPSDVIVVGGRETHVERDINYAWEVAQSLADSTRALTLPDASSGVDPTRAGHLGATTNRGRFASRKHTPPRDVL